MYAYILLSVLLLLHVIKCIIIIMLTCYNTVYTPALYFISNS